MNVEDHRARGIGSVSDMDAADGQVPEEPGVNGPEGKLAALGTLAGARDVVQQPANFAAGEVSIDHQPGFSWIDGACPSRRSWSQNEEVRRSCQTIALWIGCPVRRSQSTVVSR